MRFFAQQIFFGAIIELVSLFLGTIAFKNRPKTAFIIFAIGTVIAGIVAFGPSIPPDTPLPTPTDVMTIDTPIIPHSQTSSPSLKVTQTSTSTNLVFSENFESGSTNNFHPFPSGSFYVTKDETGNFVYEIANFSTSEYPAADFGSSNWKDYAVEYKVRFLEYKGANTQATLYIRKAYRGGAGYHVELVPSINKIRLAYYNNSWSEISSEQYKFEKNIWYLIRAEVKGNEIKLFINNKQVLYAIDKRLQSGELSLMAGPGTQVQFDDIQVLLFEE